MGAARPEQGSKFLTFAGLPRTGHVWAISVLRYQQIPLLDQGHTPLEKPCDYSFTIVRNEMTWLRSWYNTWKATGKGKHVVTPVLQPLVKLNYATWDLFLASYLTECPELMPGLFVRFVGSSKWLLHQESLVEDLLGMLEEWRFDHDPDKIRNYTRRNVSVAVA